MKEKLVVKKMWNNPTISMTMDNEALTIGMFYDDYLNALVETLGNPTTLVTKAQLKKKLLEAHNVVVGQLKKETRHFI